MPFFRFVKHSLFAAFLCIASSLHAQESVVLDATSEIAPKVKAAREILDSWQAKDAVKGKRVLHIVLWTPSDREPAPQYRERLSAIMKDIQKFYAREMNRLGFGERTIQFDLKADQLLNIHVVKGRKPYAVYNGDSGHEIRNECTPMLRSQGINPETETVVIFCNMSNWDPQQRRITQNSPYYAGGSSRSGTAWQVDSPILNLASLADKGNHVSDGQYGNISLGRYNSIFIGGVCHELGHALGLPHNLERDDERKAFGTALMGSGNRSYGEELRGESKGSFLTLAHGLRLASHPIFCGSIKDMNLKPQIAVSNVALEEKGKGFVFRANVKATPPVYAVVAYMDPTGGSDYDSTSCTAIPDKDGNFELDCQALRAGKSGELRVCYMFANGASSGIMGQTPYRYSYVVDAQGKVDISAARTRVLLEPFTAAFEKNDVAAMKAYQESEAVKNNALCQEIMKRLLASNAPKLIDLKQIPAEQKNVPLSDIRALSEKSGYGAALRDRVPAPGNILLAGSRIFRHGIYAHAPGQHEWELDGTWKTLSGHCGNYQTQSGILQFQIIGDDRVLWDSGSIPEGQIKPFLVSLENVKRLKLLTLEWTDGGNFDWALWLEPTLNR
jgi:hypothetical protein